MKCGNILIVEDDNAVSSMMADVLELHGYTVHTAADGEEGILKLRQMWPEPCVIVLDLMMPKTNGWQFLDAQRNDPKLAEIPVVVCSAYAESAKSVHPDSFVAKPVQYHDLIGAIRSHCA